MTLDETVVSFNSFISNLITKIKWVRFRKGKSGLESVQASNTRKILINLGSARMIIDRLIQRSTDPTQLTDLRILLNSLNLEVLKPDQTNFKNETTSLEKWNTAETELIDRSEKLAIEFERQISTSMRIGTMEYYSRRIEQRISKYKYT